VGNIVVKIEFDEEDFAIFERRKQTGPRYNDRRRQVREKMKAIEGELTPQLQNRGIVLNSKVSISGINPIYKKKVDGIWIAYTSSLRRYFETPQLNCGIYENGFFVGIEIPSKNRRAQLSFVDACVDTPELIEMMSEKLQTGIGSFMVYLPGTLGKHRRGCSKERRCPHFGESHQVPVHSLRNTLSTLPLNLRYQISASPEAS
jgi:hypothetical protein